MRRKVADFDPNFEPAINLVNHRLVHLHVDLHGSGVVGDGEDFASSFNDRPTLTDSQSAPE